jgi:lipid-A-disaccharide synthase
MTATAVAGPASVGQQPRFFIVAAEESGDQLGAALMRALQARTGAPIEFRGVGGPAMAQQGLASLFPVGELAIIGFTAIPRRLPGILRRIRETADAVLAAKPDALVIIDSPDFTHRVARRVRATDPSIPIIDYVSPSVWAWRPWRARAMRRYLDHVLALLPFEPEVHRQLGGPPCSYVGHPLTEQVAALRPSAEEAGRRLADPPVILVLPGSRGGEIRRLAGIFGDAIGRVQDRAGPLEVVVPTVARLLPAVTEATAGWPVKPRIVTDHAEKQAAFRVARAALAKSGTVTLELALAGIPMVTAYRVSGIEYVVGRLMVAAPSMILTNLILGENVIPEFLQGVCTAEALAETLLSLLGDTEERRRQVEAFARLDRIMEIGAGSPAERAADIVLAALRRDPGFAAPRPNR